MEPQVKVTLKKAIGELQKNNLAKELDEQLLLDMCDYLQVDPDGDNAAVEQILGLYYCDNDRGQSRSQEDLFFFCDYTVFPLDPCIKYLCSLINQPGFLKLDGKYSQLFEAWMVVNFERFDGKKILRPCASIVGIIAVFNGELEECGRPKFFQSLNTTEAFTAFVMTNELRNRLQNVLHFDSDS